MSDTMATIEEADFGKMPDGKEVKLYTLTNQQGSKVEIVTYGATWRSWIVKDKTGKSVDIVLGYDSLEGYLNGEGYLGHTIGRVCNRVREGKFSLEEQAYILAVNNGPNHLHGGTHGFSHKIWEPKIDAENNRLILSYTSPDGEEGYPGQVTTHVTYQLTNENEVRIEYSATTTKKTPINLTNHAYFNLAGEGEASIADHEIRILADNYMPGDRNNLVTGEIRPVDNTPYDLRQPRTFGEQMKALGNEGFDNNYCLNANGSVILAARTGITLETSTNQVGVQLYTANFLNQTGKAGKQYRKHCSFCLETQGYPDAINHPDFPTVVLSPGESYNHVTVYKCTS